MILVYSGKSAPSAKRIANESDDIVALRQNNGDINFGRARANTSLNPDISNSTNKRLMREVFRDNNVPMPKLLSEVFLLNGIHNFPVVGRPDKHTRGRGFWLCRNPSDVSKALRGTRQKRAATHFMEYIEADREYRVHIFKGKSIRISEKDFDGEGKYTTAKPQHEVKHVRKAAKRAVEALGLDFGCVDVLATDDRAWVLEVNAAPGLGGSTPRLYAQVFKQWQEGEYDG